MSTATSSSQHTSSRDDAQMQAEESMLRERMGDIRQKLLVLSGKGGVGKSTVAANLAAALGQSWETRRAAGHRCPRTEHPEADGTRRATRADRRRRTHPGESE